MRTLFARAIRWISLCVLPILAAGNTRVWAQASSATHTWNTPGTYTVTLKVCNWKGCDTQSQSITVLDPTPAITFASTEGLFENGVAVHQGELVHLFGSGTGQPALGFQWLVDESVSGTPTATPPAGAETWWDSSSATPGVYFAHLHLANLAGSTDSVPFSITVLPPVALQFFTLTPCRVFDSRTAGGPLHDVTAIAIPVDTCGIPPEARALAVNLTTVTPTGSGKLNLYPGNYPVPGTSESSFRPGVTRANNLVVGIATAGAQAVAARPAFDAAGGTVDVVLDVFGYFAPVPSP